VNGDVEFVSLIFSASFLFPYRSVKKLRSGLEKFSYPCCSWFVFVLKDFPLGCSLLFLWIFLRFAFF
jgi:hypothetical protein